MTFPKDLDRITSVFIGGRWYRCLEESFRILDKDTVTWQDDTEEYRTTVARLSAIDAVSTE